MRLGWALPVERLSPTSLSTFVACPEQWRQKYLVREVSEAMYGPRFIGIVDHEVAKRMAREKMTGVPTQDIDELYQSAWNETLSRFGEVVWEKDDPVEMAKRGALMAKLYAQEIVPTLEPLLVEERLEFRVEGIPVPIVGYCDVIESDRVRERKTTGVKTTKPKAKWRFQGIVYQYATGLPVQWDVVTRQATPQIYTAHFFPDLFLPLLPLSVGRQLIWDAAWRMNSLYKRYGPDNVWPMDGIVTSDWACNYCPVGPRQERTCPAWTQ